MVGEVGPGIRSGLPDFTSPSPSHTLPASVTSTALVNTQGSTTPDTRHAMPRSWSAAAARRAGDRPRRVTLALPRTKARARARPKPAEPPVMRTWSPAKAVRGDRRGMEGARGCVGRPRKGDRERVRTSREGAAAHALCCFCRPDSPQLHAHTHAHTPCGAHRRRCRMRVCTSLSRLCLYRPY